MKAQILKHICDLNKNNAPLELAELPDPVPGDNEVLIKVSACGVCHTELDEIEGRTPPPHFPVIPGHQVVGVIQASGKNVTRLKIGDRVGVGWIHAACGKCKFCMSGLENLCPDFKATGRDADGGYAEYMTVPEPFAYPVPEYFSDAEAAPLLCAGAIGYRSLRLTNLKHGQKLGLTGFGASAHLVLKMVRHKYPDVHIYVFARNKKEQAFSKELGAVWAGDTADPSPEKLDCIIDTTPVWKPVVEALKNIEPGGRLVINAIRKEDRDKACLQHLDYPTHLWMEKEIKSVANVSSSDIIAFLDLAADMKIKPDIEEYALEDGNRALLDLKKKQVRGAKVLMLG